MKLVYTAQALKSLQEALDFLASDVNHKKLMEIRDEILGKADGLLKNPKMGKIEYYLEHLGQGHRRIIEGNYKIIYLVKDEAIYVTDIFDVRQDPAKMKA